MVLRAEVVGAELVAELVDEQAHHVLGDIRVSPDDGVTIIMGSPKRPIFRRFICKTEAIRT
jgi:hypothetical protein